MEPAGGLEGVAWVDPRLEESSPNPVPAVVPRFEYFGAFLLHLSLGSIKTLLMKNDAK